MLDDLKSIYFSSEDNMDSELFLPVLSASENCRCMSGYFRSTVLVELAKSISYFLSDDCNKIQLIVSPNFGRRDLDAIKEAIEIRDNIIPHLIPKVELSEDLLKHKTIEALSYLLVKGKLEMKIAVTRAGMFHVKCWLMDTGKGCVAIHGSANATENGISHNFEQLSFNRSWDHPQSKDVVKALDSKFKEIWEGNNKSVRAYSLNEKTINYLKDIYSKSTDFNASNAYEDLVGLMSKGDNTLQDIVVPEYINYKTGEYSHQGEAVSSWIENDYSGILSIATGGGKTITSLIAASYVSKMEESLFVVVAVPTTTLVQQWQGDIESFSVRPVGCNSSNSKSKLFEIKDAIRRIKFKSSKVEIALVTHDALKDERYLSLFKKASNNNSLMLIADEVHNLGSSGFIEKSPDFFKYRIGLSATAERQMDEIGTEFLKEYFAGIVYEFSLENAIGKCLVPYNYFPHKVYLDESESDEWLELTFKIKKLSFSSELADGAPEKERWKLLCLKRRRIVESAFGKISSIKSVLNKEKERVRRTLIFATDKYPSQLKDLNQVLLQRGIRFHQVTSEETKNKVMLKRIIQSFSNDDLQVLTSKKVLDEGFNVPQTETAYLLASNTIRRQWIQRLGRVLRISKETNKSLSTIHDFIVIPPLANGDIDDDHVSLVRSELSRVQFFNSMSNNGLEKDGSSSLISELLEILEKK